MINPYVATPSYESYYLQKEAKEDENDTPSGANMDKLLSTIKCNRLIREQYYGCGYTCDIEPVPIRDIRLTYDYKKWKSKINGEFKLVVDSFLFSFARKLNKKNYGSFAEKKFFLSVISREISIAYPFKMISDLMTNFIENKVVKTVTRYSQKKIKYISNRKS
ncbi:hypothetical protein, partial [Candidatus Ichthyocystis sparus]|uniref:hypothetical protein n=1 Tax=Candidatus Ichthyocystis sparus TaxID=1561004 RepID=UPI0011466A11